MIADTDFIINLARNDLGALAKARELHNLKEPLATTVITLFELWRGTGRLTYEESRIVNELIGKSLIIVLEAEAAELAGIISSRLRKKGYTLGSRDCLIAGITLAGNDVLLTRNVKDFAMIEGIKLETY